jgi:hypothetical protein
MKRKFISLFLTVVSLNVFALQKQETAEEIRQTQEVLAQAASLSQNSDPQLKNLDGFGKFAANFKRRAKKACFVEGTLILLASETLECKAIEDLKVGDKILSFDEESNTLVSKTVEELFRLQADSIVEIQFDNGQLVEVTEDHLFHVDGEWKTAADLQEGNLVSGSLGFLRVKSLLLLLLEEPIQVYDIRVESTHK